VRTKELAIVAVWLAVVIGGFVLLAQYKGTAGPIGEAGARWPEGTFITRSPERATLVMFAHPMCPCTRASVSVLRAMADDVRGRADLHVVVVLPEGSPEEWRNGDLVSAVRDITGARVWFDERGREAKRFGAQTSGDVSVYGIGGARLYHGGITPSRGHEGESAGRLAALAAANGKTTTPVTSKVFGCPLEAPARTKESEATP
jgi:hypothetical protein